MLSFFSRKSLIFNTTRPAFYDTKLSKYIIDTTNKIKQEHKNVHHTNILKQLTNTNTNTNTNSFIPIISILSFLAGYYLLKYNN